MVGLLLAFLFYGGHLILLSKRLYKGRYTISMFPFTNTILADDFSLWILTVYGPSVHGYHANYWQELYDLAGVGGDS